MLARAKDTSTGGLEEAGILRARAGKVRLLRRDELDEGWDPAADRRPTVWEATHHLARRLETGGESAAAELLRRLGGLGEVARARLPPVHDLRAQRLGPGGARLQRARRRLAGDCPARERHARAGGDALMATPHQVVYEVVDGKARYDGSTLTHL